MIEWVNIESMNRNLDNDILRVKKSELDTFLIMVKVNIFMP